MMTDSKLSLNDNIEQIGENDGSDSENNNRDYSSKYVPTRVNDENIELKELKKSSSDTKNNPDESNERDDLHEDNTLKPPLTKEEAKMRKGSNKVHSEDVMNEGKKSILNKKNTYLTIDTADLKDMNISA